MGNFLRLSSLRLEIPGPKGPQCWRRRIGRGARHVVCQFAPRADLCSSTAHCFPSTAGTYEALRKVLT